MKRNPTVSIRGELLQQTRALAAQRRKSISGMLAEELEAQVS